MGYGDTYNVSFSANGKNIMSYSYSPCCCSRNYMMPPMGSCFGYGFYGGGFGAGLGMGLGVAAGAALIPALPSVFKGIGKACSWLGTKVIAPAATFVWNKALKPAGKAIWNGIKWVGNGIAKGAKAIGKGISKLWHKIFHKKSKSV